MYSRALAEKRLSGGEMSLLKGFIYASAREMDEYNASLSAAEKEVSGSDVAEIAEEEVDMLFRHIDRLKNQRAGLDAVERDIQQGRFGTESQTFKLSRSIGKGVGRLKKSVKKVRQLTWTYSGLGSIVGLLKKYRTARRETETSKSELDRLSQEQRVSLGAFKRALGQAFLSYASLRTTFRGNATIWNYFFITRSLFWSPAKWLMLVIYPNYFNVAIATTKGHQHFPSHYNAGLDRWPTTFKRLISSGAHGAGVGEFPVIRRLVLSREVLEGIRSFEEAVAPMESLAMKVALKKAQMALLENIDDPDRIAAIFDSTETSRDSGATTGIRNLHDPKIKSLNKGERIFYRAYFTRTFDELMQGFITSLSTAEVGENETPVQFAKRLRAEVKSGKKLGLASLDADQMNQLEVQVEAALDFDKIRDWSYQVKNQFSHFWERMSLQFRHQLLSKHLYPGNYQMNRFLEVRKLKEETRAMERAMRLEVASLFAGVPMGLLTVFGLYAGVQTGVLQPFNPDGLNSDTHLNYMSRYLLINGFALGFIFSMLGSTWMKLQEDSRVADLGGFKKVLKMSDGARGFWRYYFKNVFLNPVNKWRSNQVFYLKLIYANISAAAVTGIIMDMASLGRFDVGMFLASYIMIFTLPIVGYHMKMEQAFELASAWFYDRIPRKLRAHPDAQKFIGLEIQKRKILIGYLDQVFNTVVLENIMGSMVTLKDNTIIGTRAFFRLLFGGETPTVILSNFVDGLVAATEKVPGMSSVLETFKYLFTNNYEAFERFPDRLPDPPPGIDRIVENPNLPENALGETLGKTGAMATLLGVVTAIPYWILGWEERRSQRNIQNRGDALIESGARPLSEFQTADTDRPTSGVLSCRSIF